jgi:hypothetical protein
MVKNGNLNFDHRLINTTLGVCLEEMRLVKGNQDIGETYVYVLGP